MEVWLRRNRVKAFYENIACPHLRMGVAHMLQALALFDYIIQYFIIIFLIFITNYKIIFNN